MSKELANNLICLRKRERIAHRIQKSIYQKQLLKQRIILVIASNYLGKPMPFATTKKRKNQFSIPLEELGNCDHFSEYFL